MPDTWPLLFISCLICAGVTGAIADGKGRSFIGWAILGLFFGPVAILVAAAVGRGDGAPDFQPASMPDELIKLAALRDRGDLSDEEFQAAKTRLLA